LFKFGPSQVAGSNLRVQGGNYLAVQLRRPDQAEQLNRKANYQYPRPTLFKALPAAFIAWDVPEFCKVFTDCTHNDQ
jgi:hypothetical protein